jgi:hypothetical protein
MFFAKFHQKVSLNNFFGFGEKGQKLVFQLFQVFFDLSN